MFENENQMLSVSALLHENHVRVSDMTPTKVVVHTDDVDKATQLLTGYDVEIKVERPVMVESTKKENKQVSVTFRDLFEIIKFW